MPFPCNVRYAQWTFRSALGNGFTEIWIAQKVIAIDVTEGMNFLFAITLLFLEVVGVYSLNFIIH
jgi:hypothetical protein